MTKLYCGPAATAFSVSNDGIAQATTTGLFLTSNAGPLSAKLLEASFVAEYLVLRVKRS
jgi:hypothetical protein